jgi:hypothetical protein
MSFKMIEPEEVTTAKLLSSSIAEHDHAAWSNLTDYAINDLCIVTGDTHAIFKAAAASGPSNGGAVDPTSAAVSGKWVNIASTNRWKPFDQYIGDPATASTSAEWRIQADGIVDGIALFGLSAASVNIIVTDATEGEVYNKTHSLQDETGVVDAYTYHFSPIIRFDSLVVTDIAPFFAPEVRIVVSEPGGTLEVGQIVIGRQEVIGTTLNNLSFGIQSFSRKERDEFGRYSIKQRDSADTMTPPFAYKSSKGSYLRSRLKAREAKATVYAADSQYRANDYAIYGFFKEFRPIARYGEISEGSIELESIV